MKFTRFFLLVTVITLAAIVYVYQQTEIIRLAYVGQKKKAMYDELHDKNNLLKFTIERNASLIRLGTKVSACPDFQMPDSYRLLHMNLQEPRLRTRLQKNSVLSFLARFFSVKRQAEAKTVIPSQRRYSRNLDLEYER